MKYEVYKQEDVESTDRTTRFYTTIKATAFKFMDEKNKLEGKNVWRVAICVKDRICFDIDRVDCNNVIEIKNYYSKLFGDFRIIRTNAGFHLISEKRYNTKSEWIYDECRVLYPLLPKNKYDIQKYIFYVRKFYRELKKDRGDMTKEQFLEKISTEFKESGLYCGHGDFDILFSINVIFRGYHCIRISKKSKDDVNEEVTIYPSGNNDSMR